MPRAPQPPASPSAMVPALLRLAAARGAALGDLATRLGLPPDAADREELTVADAALAELVDAAAAALGDPALGLRLPAELPLRRYEVAELALRASPSLRAGLATAARYASTIHPALVCELDEQGPGPEARWLQHTPSAPRGLGRQLDLYGLAYVLGGARAGLPGGLPVTRAWFAHARPRALAPLQQWFGTEDLAFGAPHSGFAFSRALLATPLGGDPRLLATVTALAAAQPAPRAAELSPRVIAELRACPAAAAAEVARALAVSARTLQRRLEAEGTTFSACVDRAREGLARELLADPALALAAIAERVGFADLAAFSRAFKRWTGEPPGQFRRR